jgi:hypothetical protein
MDKMRKIGFGFLISAILFHAINTFLPLPLWVTKKLCGDMYMIEPNEVVRAKGHLTDAACGFDADMVMAAIAITLVLLGMALVLLSLRK